LRHGLIRVTEPVSRKNSARDIRAVILSLPKVRS
jgi:hypothetical protein